ncbi:MAG TPA: Uma2 family endonuclease [Abditibacteriaceae bacterium]|jgi:Uma2 family endonuclease
MTQRVLDINKEASPRISYEEFLAQADEDVRAEWVNGQVIIDMTPVTTWHQNLEDFLTALIRYYAEVKELGQVRSAGYQMRIAQPPSGREPDIVFVRNENLTRMRETFLDGPADLVVEIISPESRARDRGEKYYEYEAGGVCEYWLLDPQRKQAEWYQLDDKGIYQLVAAQDSVYHSRVLEGLWLRESWLWQPPTLREVLREWKLI